MMTAGKFQHRLEIQAPVQVQDPATGEVTTSWQVVGTVWARIEPIRGKEAFVSEQVLADMNTRITLRWSPLAETLTNAHRGIHQNTIFNFVSIAHVRLERREVEIMARSGLNDG